MKGVLGTDTMKVDLGMGLSGTNKIPCKAIRGLTPVTGFNVNCTFTVGASPTIEITNY